MSEGAGMWKDYFGWGRIHLVWDIFFQICIGGGRTPYPGHRHLLQPRTFGPQSISPKHSPPAFPPFRHLRTVTAWTIAPKYSTPFADTRHLRRHPSNADTPTQKLHPLCCPLTCSGSYPPNNFHPQPLPRTLCLPLGHLPQKHMPTVSNHAHTQKQCQTNFTKPCPNPLLLLTHWFICMHLPCQTKRLSC